MIWRCFTIKNLQKIREKKGLSQAKVAMEIESSQEVISAYESGKYGIGPDNLCKLADLFHCTTDYLLDRTDEPTSVSKQHDNMTEKETDLLSNFKMLNKTNQDIVSGYVQGILSMQYKRKD